MKTSLVQRHTLTHKAKTVFVPTALALFLSACTGSGFFKNPVTDTLKNEAYSSSEYYINQADKAADKEDRVTYRLMAVRKLVEENKAVEAQNTFEELNAALQDIQKNEIQKVEYDLVSAQLAALQGDETKARTQLKLLPKQLLSNDQLLRVYKTEARLAERNNDVLETVRAKSLVTTLLTNNKDRQTNNDQIWAILRQANKGTLANAKPNTGDIETGGWLALINMYNQNITNPEKLPQGISNWKQLYPNHSATTIMPTELQGVANFQHTQASNIALLLPLSGDAKILGEIIKKGFDEAKGEDPTNVQVYDTDSAGVTELIAQAKTEGSQMIVGPLLKPRVDEMVLSPEVGNINVLALNSTEQQRPNAHICYYGLSPESEAKAGAEKIQQDRFSRAIVITPQDDFGQRSADAFAKRWRQLTQTDADVRYYNQPMDAIAAIQNEGNAQGSAIYALGTAEQVLEIKLAIDNSTLKGTPIYTSSRSNSPNNGIEFNTSMEGVKFSEVPLLSDPESDEYKKADSLASSDFSMMRLYAMGADAWSLANKFNEFRQIPGYSVSGLTGKLTAGAGCNIERGMTWLQYSNGAVSYAN